MRGLLIAILFAAPGLAGCLTDSPAPESQFDLESIEVPDGATLHPDANGAYLLFDNPGSPWTMDVEIPEGVNRISLVAKGQSTEVFAPYLFNAETERRRCNTDYVTAWNRAAAGSNYCSGLTAVDRPGDVWTARVTGPAAAEIHVHFDASPVGGIAGLLDLESISPKAYAPGEFFWTRVAGHDGTELHVEVSLPDGEGPWPVIISSSPYNHELGATERPERAMWAYFAHDWTTRGYAVINADVRGYGESDGCVTVWGIDEQLDQVALVEWAAEQDWSTGAVGFYGQSYLGTTAVEAAVYAPEALKAIVAVAPVTRNYDDWHHGGVPNGESSGSPVAYQVLTGMASNVYTSPGGEGQPGPDATLLHAAGGLCDATLVAEANDPRHIYNSFYEERDFAARAGDIAAAVLYTQGFEDSNVKSTMIPRFFNDITAPKLGLFGHFVHQHPTRADQEALFLAWFDHFLKGIDNGVDQLPNADVVLESGEHRTTDAWPTASTEPLVLYPDFAATKLALDPTASDATLLLRTVVGDDQLLNNAGATRVSTWYEFSNDTAISGTIEVPLTFHLEGATNAYAFAELYLDGARMTFGGWNAAHNNEHTDYNPVVGVVDAVIPMLPTEFIAPAGSNLRLVITTAAAGDEALGFPGQGAGQIVLHGTADADGGVRLVLPTLPLSDYAATPTSAQP